MDECRDPLWIGAGGPEPSFVTERILSMGRDRPLCRSDRLWERSVDCPASVRPLLLRVNRRVAARPGPRIDSGASQ